MADTAALTVRRSVTSDMADRFGMEVAAFEQTLRATVVPKECTREQFAAFLLVAKQYSLNPLTKEIFAFPAKGGGIVPVVSVDGWVRIINDHDQMDGLEFDDHLTEDGLLTAITARIYRKDRSKPIAVTEYMEECERATDTWKKWPRRMLRHKATIQAARYAFGFSGIYDIDEAERMPAGAGIPSGEAPALNSSQAKKANLWPDLEAEIRGFTDLSALEEWWASGETQARIASLPQKWQAAAQEEYEKAQEALAQKIHDDLAAERAANG